MVQRILYGFLIVIMCTTIGCTPDVEKPKLNTGIWRGTLILDNNDSLAILPFNFIINQTDSGKYQALFFNGEEQIDVEDVTVTLDSIYIKMPFYDSEIRATYYTGQMMGFWHNYSKGDNYVVPFKAQYDIIYRFKPTGGAAQYVPINGRWDVTFSPEKSDSSKAIGEFKNNSEKVAGTFLTETGDFRYLDGVVTTKYLYLSCFDGSHAFLFVAEVNENTTMKGRFWSGTHHKENWTAIRNENVKLRDPDSLTFLKEGYDKFEFSFPDMDGENVSLSDPVFSDKVVIVQIMGSWCPNCIDETFMLAKIYDEYKPKGLEIIALAFEKSTDMALNKNKIQKIKQRTGAAYPFLYAGPPDRIKAAEKLPMLNHIMSYPTTILIDKTGKVRRIHTGFSGPGTGEHFIEFEKELREFLEELIQM